MYDFDDAVGKSYRKAVDQALAPNRALEMARGSLGVGERLGEISARMSRDQGLIAGLASGTSALHDTIASMAAADDAFRSRLAGIANPLGRNLTKPPSPFQVAAATLGTRLHDQIAGQHSITGLAGRIADASRIDRTDMFAMAQRNARWATGLVEAQNKLDRLLGVDSFRDLATTLNGARSIAEQVAGLGYSLRLDPKTATLAANLTLHDTMTKMSAVAGSLGMTGALSRATDLSIHSLLGDWHTRTDLPGDYWRDPRARSRLYRDADVDPGLIDADKIEVVDLMVDSGMVEGGHTRSGATVAIISMGPFAVRITASRPTSRTYEAIDAFEWHLKVFLDTILTEKIGPDWFVQCFDAKTVDEAKRKRGFAQRGGEDWKPLIWFLDIGPLIALVIRGDNWSHFKRYFGDPQFFAVGLRQLMAIRNPAMHARGVDHIQMVEAIVLINKFETAMGRTTAIDQGWDDDI